MANCCGGVLAAEVSKAGGLGLVGHANTLENLKIEVEKGRKHLGLKDDDPLPFGVGLVLWKLETPEVTQAEAGSLSSSFLSYVVSLSAHSVWLAFSPRLEEWVKRYRQTEAKEGKRKEAFVLVMTSRTEDTLAARDWEGVDAVVAQGTDAGGHGPGHKMGLPLADLLEKVLPRYPPTTRPFLLAAGGLSSSDSISNVLSKYPSVAGVVAGTAFTVADESLWARPQKELVVQTKSAEETDRGLEWDEIRNQLGWEKGIDGRAIRNKTRGREQSLYADGKLEKGLGPNLDEVGVWAGTGVGDVKSIKPAAEILRDLVSNL
ncbi:nitronate monooxygenase [Sporobolomyces salmoneus]|uniref:nitronate monooxygenase n=1 Tax=Sporobolomyces salmoneus TaxID=183962 RepID=UPI00317F4EF9